MDPIASFSHPTTLGLEGSAPAVRVAQNISVSWQAVSDAASATPHSREAASAAVADMSHRLAEERPESRLAIRGR